MKTAHRYLYNQIRFTNNKSKVLALKQPLNIISLVFILSTSLVFLIRVHPIYIPHPVPYILKSPLSLSPSQPDNLGYITIKKINNLPVTILTAGDSLARGKGSTKVNGKLANIGYDLVRQINTLNPGVSQYKVLPGLSVDGSSVKQTNEQIEKQRIELSMIPNLVLILSFTNRDVQNFVLDAEDVHGGNYLNDFFQITQILNRDSKTYQNSLKLLTQTISQIQQQREKILGPKDDQMQAVILGLPNEEYSPTVQAVLKRYHITYGEFSYVINLFNSDDRTAAVSANNINPELTYSFVNLDKIRIPAKIVLTELSSDEFHPNYRGYESLSNFVQQNVLLSDKSHYSYLARM